MRTKRQGIIVWFQHMKNIKQIKRYGHLIYVSRQLKYAVLYVQQEEVPDKQEKLDKLPFVSKVDLSYKPFIKTEYESVPIDKSKELDYKMGI